MSIPNEPTILVEKHYIPVSIYNQIYCNSTQNSVPITSTNTRQSYISPTSIFGQSRTSNPTTSNGNTTIRTSRRTTFSSLNPNNLNNSINSSNMTSENNQENGTNNHNRDINNLADQFTQQQNRTGSSSIRIETLASGDDNDINLFNALFAALINPSRLNGSNSNQDRSTGLTTNQIEDNSTVITYNMPDSLDSHPSSSICSICTLEYEPNQQVRSLDACDHAFHTGCIDRWLADHNTCPLCRSSVLPGTTNTSNRPPPTSSSRTNTTRVDLNGLD